ncbi:hypothetical protein N0V83_006197 [Neocucurbitaria cava]|uniref:Heterokaryon incompatibility domain-containing protein n=1 Tax=Neocucurbitaria cava TaxID=798079 RepID=A0A9W8Y933_9PLEO|nr:hypothetical protein N0V83_006197 [Neocucurbitaria cava]
MSEDGFLDYLLQDRMFSIQIPHYHGQHRGEDAVSDSEPQHILARYMETADSLRFEADVEGSTWNSRGWTLQERHLARRIVHFSRTQIFWECRRGIESECGQRIIRLPFSITPAYGPEDSPDEESSENTSSQCASDKTSRSDEIGSSSSDSAYVDEDELIATRTRLYLWWFQVLGDYSRRNLTYASDKLPAISGLARELNTNHLEITQSEDQYLAGLWLGALADCLLWTPEDSSAMTDPGISRAPSWSWARYDGPTMPTRAGSPNLDPESDKIEYISHEVGLDSSNAYGSITHARLSIRAGLHEVLIVQPSIQQRDEVNRYDIYLRSDRSKIAVATLDRAEAYETNDTSGLFAMQVKVQLPQDDGPARDLYYSGLVLQLVGGEEQVLERVGVFILDEDHLNVFASAEKRIVTLV